MQCRSQPVDLLDIVGPLEMLFRATDQNGQYCFKPTFADPVKDESVPTAQWASATPKICHGDALADLATCDILLVPGDPSGVVKPLINESNMIVQITKAFSQLVRPDEDRSRPRVLLSVCTRAFFPSLLGLVQRLEMHNALCGREGHR